VRARFVVAAATAALALAGTTIAAIGQPTQTRSTHATALLARVNVAASEFKFVLSKKSARRGLVTFKVTNVGTIQHDFQIKGQKTRFLSHGQSATLRVTFLRKGHYPYKCTVAGHAAAGMRGVFTIT
jgi:uncharacterized cupredoxin-like copper-binding protein